MYLYNLIKAMEKALRLAKQNMEQYMHIPVVNDFIYRKEADLEAFKRMVRAFECKDEDEVAKVISVLKNKPIESKYLGMCDRGAEYFDLTEDVEKAIAFYEASKACESDIRFDADYAIYDELEETILDELYGSKDTD